MTVINAPSTQIADMISEKATFETIKLTIYSKRLPIKAPDRKIVTIINNNSNLGILSFSKFSHLNLN